MRINRYLALKKISTRRGADELVEQKKVFINGKLAVLGSKVNEKDIVEVKEDKNKKAYIYFAYNKPIDTITHSPQKGEHDIKQDLKIPNMSKADFDSIFPVGRLDKNSHGLIILTNDGRITDQLLNPKYFHEKEYIVKTSNKLRSNFKQKMEAGVNIDPVRSKSPRGGCSTPVFGRAASNGIEGYQTKKCKVIIVNDFTFKIILTEGKKHQIRRMCSALFQEVADLKRERIMNIKLGNLKLNTVREIKGEELSTFLNSIFS
jgi:23S rRNA pseudouridine2604 synthase